MRNPFKALSGIFGSSVVHEPKALTSDAAVRHFKQELDRFISADHRGDPQTAISPSLLKAAQELIECHQGDCSARCAFAGSFGKLEAGWFVDMADRLARLPAEMDMKNNGATHYAMSFFRQSKKAEPARMPATA